MTMKTLTYILSLALMLGLISCDRWVDGASTPKDTLSPEQIRRPRMLASVRDKKLYDGPLVARVRALSGEAFAAASLALGAMADELTEGQVPNGLLYRHLSSDAIQSNSGTADGLWNSLQDLRARTAELLEVEQAIAADASADLAATKAYARFIGHLHHAQALQLLAETFSTTPGAVGGSVRIRGVMQPHSALLDEAERHYRLAIETAQSPELQGYSGVFDGELSRRTATSLLVRLLLHRDRYEKIIPLLTDILTDREEYVVVYSAQGGDNPLYSALNSESRDVQVTRSLEQARGNEAERKALPLAHKIIDKKRPDVYNIYVPSLTRHSALVVIDAAELMLVKAELAVRNVIRLDATAEVNRLIARYDEASQETGSLTLDRLAHLRRIYLALRGERTADLRRSLEATASAEWAKRKNQWIPLPERELKAPLAR